MKHNHLAIPPTPPAQSPGSPAIKLLRAILLGALSVAWLTGCQTYQAKPLDISTHSKKWAAQSLDQQRVRTFANALNQQYSPTQTSKTTFAIDDGISLAEAQAIALVFNADLRVLRASSGVEVVSAKEAGRWDDPELDLDLARIVDAGSRPWITGVGIGFTIPLSDRLEIEKDQAWAQYRYAWRSILVQENELIKELRIAWRNWSAIEQQIHLHEQFVKQLTELGRVATALAAKGELRPTDARVLEIERVSVEADIAQLHSTKLEHRASLLALMGLTPQAKLQFTPTAVSRSGNGIPKDVHALILNHPKLNAARAKYEIAEQELRREIAKQLPDLTIGPSYENEEGQSRIGLTAGIPIPVLNANKQGIVAAKASRDAARVDAHRTYEVLYNELKRAELAYQRAADRQRVLSTKVAPLIDQQIADIKKIIEIGELDVLLLQDVLEKSFNTRTSLLDAAVAQSVASDTIQSLIAPKSVTPPVSQPTDQDDAQAHSKDANKKPGRPAPAIKKDGANS
jgi:outer membrane protein, heavy metal efflux system